MTEKNNDNKKQNLWYVRRKGEISGPYPSGGIRRFVLLGRVDIHDEVSVDQQDWQPVAQVPAVVPPDIRHALENGDEELLIAARLREDERNGRERRVAADDGKYRQRRKGERRQAELEIIQNHRQAKIDLLEKRRKKPLPLFSMITVGALVMLAIGSGIYLGAPVSIPDPDCDSKPVPGVNWRNCKLDGLQLENAELDGVQLSNGSVRGARLSAGKFNRGDMQYVDLSDSDLSYAELKSASMKGATLRYADLSYADLSGADLSFADLTGANLGGAAMHRVRLDNAIWINGALCQPGSLGNCVIKP